MAYAEKLKKIPGKNFKLMIVPIDGKIDFPRTGKIFDFCKISLDAIYKSLTQTCTSFENNYSRYRMRIKHIAKERVQFSETEKIAIK